MASIDVKRSSNSLSREMKEFMDAADARQRAVERAMDDLEVLGSAGVKQVLTDYGEQFSPAERKLLENATDDDIQKLIESHRMLKRFNSPRWLLCI